jgi:SAM-dependent MidA family methyltransferase
MPFHRLRWNRNGRAWREAFVVAGNDTLTIEWRAPGKALMSYANLVESLPEPGDGPLWPRIPDELLDVLPDGFDIEVSPAALNWWSQAARSLDRGWLMTLDYGLAAADFFTPARAHGTGRAYHHHRLVDDLLARPGEQDLTAHVNFTALELAGRAAALQTDTLQSQSSFLGHALECRTALGSAELTSKQAREFQTLTHPDHLGSSFKVLVQSRPLSVVR